MLATDSYLLNTSPPSPQLKERTLFTNRDHAILGQALKHTKHSVVGNQVYIELEKMFPHHTWQSWKDYSLKKYLPNITSITLKEQENTDLPVTNYSAENTVQDIQVDNSNLQVSKKHSISEDDKARINQFLESINHLVKEYDLWDREDITTALFMSSGSIRIAKKILDVGFNLTDLDPESRSLIYTSDEDKMLLLHETKNFVDIMHIRGRSSVNSRLKFLSGVDPKLSIFV